MKGVLRSRKVEVVVPLYDKVHAETLGLSTGPDGEGVGSICTSAETA